METFLKIFWSIIIGGAGLLLLYAIYQLQLDKYLQRKREEENYKEYKNKINKKGELHEKNF